MATGELTNAEEARLSRRRALKAGVAAGVGAAAFAGPQISVLGSTPAYAAHCSPNKFTTSDGPDRNVDCGGACANNAFRLHGTDLQATVDGSLVMASVADKVCAGDAVPSITGIPSGFECQVSAVIFGGPNAGDSFPLPNANFNQGTYPCSSRYLLRLTCAPAGCFG